MRSQWVFIIKGIQKNTLILFSTPLMFLSRGNEAKLDTNRW